MPVEIERKFLVVNDEWRSAVIASEKLRDGLVGEFDGCKRPNERCVVLYLRPKDYQRFANAIMKHGARPNGSGLLNKEQALMALIDLAETVVA